MGCTAQDAEVIFWFRDFLRAVGRKDWHEAARLYAVGMGVPGD